MILLVLFVLASCTKTTCNLKPGIEIDTESIEKIEDLRDPNITPKGEVACTF